MFGKAAASVLAELHGRKDGERVLLHIKGPEIQSPYVGRDRGDDPLGLRLRPRLQGAPWLPARRLHR